MKIKKIWQLFLDACHYWSEDRATTLAAALAYYTVFSLGPLLLIAIAIAGLVFGRRAASGEILQQFGSVLGQNSAKQIQYMLQRINKPYTGIFSTIIGLIILLIGASSLFAELQYSLNKIWRAPTKSPGIKHVVKQRLWSFTMVLTIGFLLLVSLILSSLLSAFIKFVSSHFAFAAMIGEGLNFIVSLVVITLLFATIFKILPDIEITWGEVWLGSFITALLFNIGKFILGIYFGMSHISSAYGAAGSLIIILVWVYYSAQIFLFGAELTKAHALQQGRKLVQDEQRKM
jgi:membrane protein